MKKKAFSFNRFFTILLFCFVILLVFVSCSNSEGQNTDGERIKVVELKKGNITLNLPKGYSFRDTNDPEIYSETQKRLRKEKVGNFEIMKDEEIVIYLYNRPEGDMETQKEGLESLKSQITPDGPGPKGIEFLDEGTDKNGNKYLFYEYQYRDGTTEYAYVLDFPKDAKWSFQIASLNSREDAEKFFDLLDLKFEPKQ